MSDDLRGLARALHRETGIALSDRQLPALRMALRRVDPELAPRDALRGEPLDRLIDQVTVQETFFLRHRDELDEIDWRRLVDDAAHAGRPRARVWCTACATGEEAYTLALLASERLDGDAAAVEFLGTDVSLGALERARTGVYGARSVRLLDAARRERWFEPDRDRLRVGARLRRLVRFARHNLVTDPIPPEGEAPFDLVLCRNVLIYFDAQTAARTRDALRGALQPGGRLILGAADRLGAAERLGAAAPAGTTEHGSAGGLAHRRGLQLHHPAPGRASPPPRPAPRSRSASVPAPPSDPAHDAHEANDAFEAGLRALSDGDAARAATLLRRALYLEPTLAVAALQLGRAHEALSDVPAARRAYASALQAAREAGDPSTRLYDRIGAADVIAACEARLRALGGG